jgi:plasmid stabilization system protein ParE
MTHKVLLTPKATEDAEAIYRWIAGDAPDTAVDWYHGLLDALASLDALPNRCPLAREARTLRRDVRQLLYGNYRILFIIDGKVVRILRVRHGARRDLRRKDFEEGKAPKRPPE